jgi:hypothetical protein
MSCVKDTISRHHLQIPHAATNRADFVWGLCDEGVPSALTTAIKKSKSRITVFKKI